jgi:hypothetical protein
MSQQIGEQETWSVRKCKREMERLMEAEHMAPTHDEYEFHHIFLVDVRDSFRIWHPRAYKKWLETHEFRAAIERIK